MNRLNDGGQAFPKGLDELSGMTIRDYFATHAMRGLIIAQPDWGKDEGSDKQIAYIAYHLAGAMLTERDKLSCASRELGATD